MANGVLELVAGLKPGSIGGAVSPTATGESNISARNGGTMRVYVKGGKPIRDMYDFPVSLGGSKARL